MKKILALLLALLMVASVALVSCDSSDSNDGEDNDFVDDFGGFDDEDEGESGDADADENEDDGNDGAENTSNAMETVNDTVYVLYPAKIRAKASDKSSVEINGTAPFGASLTRSEKSGTWSKVTYNNGTTTVTGYIANDLISTDPNSIKFDEKKNEDGTDLVTAIKANLGSGINNAIVRKYPLADGVPNTFKILEKKTFDPASIVGQIAKGTENITVVSVSADGVWAKIKGEAVLFENGAPTTTKQVIEGYTLYSNLVIAGNASSGNNSGDAIG